MQKSRTKCSIWLKLFLIYLIAVVGYAIFAKFFSIPVHVSVDEELYISMAKSFFYQGNFSKGNEILDYSCVLYSMLLSYAYYFYSPKNIVFLFRMIGVCTMLSSIFPVYLLASRVLDDEEQGVKAAVLVCFLPSMMNVAYCMQEVLSYPLFLWLVWIVYEEIKRGKVSKISGYTLGIASFSVCGYFTKTYMIFVPIVYCLFVLYKSWETKEKSGLLKNVMFVGTYMALFMAGKCLIWCINDGIAGANHYSSQFSRLFPISVETIVAACTCIMLYTVSLCFCWGILPIILPFTNWKKHDKKEKDFYVFLFMCLVVLIVEIVVSIVLTEEGNVLFPRKVLYRYFQILEVPILLMFYKKFKEYTIPKYMGAIYSVVMGLLIVYYVYIGDRQRTSIIDAPVLLLMENINRYIIPHFNLLACGACIIFIVVTYWRQKRGKVKEILGCFVKLTVIGVLSFFMINLVQLPLYTNIIAQGKVLEQDAIKVAEYCSENKHDNVYMILSSDIAYERAINAYLEDEIIFIKEDELDSVDMMESVVISKHEDVIPLGMKERELGLRKIRVYTK